MSIKNIFFIFLLFLFSCSSSKYYECKYESPVVVYDNPQLSNSVCTIPAGNTFVSSKRVKRRRLVNYMSFSGYAEEFRFTKIRKLPNYKFLPPKSIGTITTTNEAVRSSGNNSHYSTGTSNSGSSGPVQVKGYYRNGTYVSPHTRSAPRRH